MPEVKKLRLSKTDSEPLTNLKSINRSDHKVRKTVFERPGKKKNVEKFSKFFAVIESERKKVYKYSKYWSYKKMLKTWNDQLVEPDIFDFMKFFVSRGDLVDMAEKLIFHDFRDFLPSDSVRLVRDRSSSLK